LHTEQVSSHGQVGNPAAADPQQRSNAPAAWLHAWLVCAGPRPARDPNASATMPVKAMAMAAAKVPCHRRVPVAVKAGDEPEKVEVLSVVVVM
jgi:hypothetical protein